MKPIKRKRTTSTVPQKGEPEYLTPTQLRNRRKRRAKKQGSSSSADATSDAAATAGDVTASNNNNNSKTKYNMKDPSMKFITDPVKAPNVQAAKQFFKDILQNCTIPTFRVHVGALEGWRTVSKLAVRATTPSSANNAKPKVAIGLFLPQSHTLLPVPNCRAHHPSINRAVDCIEKACHDLGVVPYQETSVAENGEARSSARGATKHSTNAGVDDAMLSKKDSESGVGQLRYVAINVARESGAVQITLVWNTPPPPPPTLSSKRNQQHGGSESIDDPILQKLVKKLIDMSSVEMKKKPSKDSREANESGVATSTDSIDTTYSLDFPPKKRRRRGRHEGKASEKNVESNNTNQGDNMKSNCNSNKPSTASELPNQTKHRNHDKLNLHSLWINYNQSWKHSNAIFSFDSTCWEHVYGPRSIIEHLNFDNKQGHANQQHGIARPMPPQFLIPLNFPPNVFRQANLDSFTNIVGRIRERMQQFDSDTITCVELYGGVGTIGLHVSDMVASLVSSDENPNNSRCFYDSVRALPPDIQSRLVYRQLNAADMVTSDPELFQRCQVLIVDPPRKGLDDEVVHYLCKEGWKTMKLVVYVSCGFPAFQRDCEMLLKSGKWRVGFAEGYLLFPGSDAIETLAFFVPLV
ncbi:hypothetical protein ACHAXH_004075 [Discostella pseudostelligera]